MTEDTPAYGATNTKALQDRTRLLATKLTSADYNCLEHLAIRAGLSFSDYVHQVLKKHLESTGEK